MKFKVIVDSREKTPWFFSKDEYCEGQTVAKLDVGDYSIAGLETEFIVERKRSVSEIAGNLTESRWPGFLERFLKIKRAFLICEFSVDDILAYPYGSNIPKKRIKYIKIRPPFILSKIAEMQLMGINIIFAGDADNAQLLAYNLMKKYV